MHAKIIVIDSRSKLQAFEALDECLVNRLIATVLVKDFLAEGESVSHGDGLMVAT